MSNVDILKILPSAHVLQKSSTLAPATQMIFSVRIARNKGREGRDEQKKT
jgi:hypothetical protein